MWHNVSSLLLLHTHMFVSTIFFEYPQLHIFFFSFFYNFKLAFFLLLYIQLLQHVILFDFFIYKNTRFRLKMYRFIEALTTFPKQHNFLSDSRQCQDYAQHYYFYIEDSIFINWCEKLKRQKIKEFLLGCLVIYLDVVGGQRRFWCDNNEEYVGIDLIFGIWRGLSFILRLKFVVLRLEYFEKCLALPLGCDEMCVTSRVPILINLIQWATSVASKINNNLQTTT